MPITTQDASLHATPSTDADARERSAPTFETSGRRIYMIGIGGCGMSGLARMLARGGAVVSGSDMSPSDATDVLVREGIAVGFDQTRDWLPEETELVVASAAIKPDHPQMLAAERAGLSVLTYAEALGGCMIGRTGIAVAGTHGKSTTTAMLGAALTDAGLDPSVIVGATCRHLTRGVLNGSMDDEAVGVRIGATAIPAGAMSGRPGVLVAEACEFNRSFHSLHPTVACINSVEADHLDVFGSLDEIVKAFNQFALLLPPADQGGYLLIAHDGAHRREVTAGVVCDVETIGFSPSADWVVGYEVKTRRTTLTYRGQLMAEWNMTLPGAHNAMNASTALVLAHRVGADVKLAAKSLAGFRGVDRRMELVGERKIPGAEGKPGVRVFDDYGHHPTEVDTTLRALRDSERPEEQGGRLICVFQPHQHSRTRHLLEEFANAFEAADIVIVPHIYFVRDSQEERSKVTASDLVDRLREKRVRAMHLYPFEAIIEQLENLCRPGDLLVVMGAGPVWQVARGYLAAGESSKDGASGGRAC
jgi:UDP-N-acetylmuramate--alanine ligase